MSEEMTELSAETRSPKRNITVLVGVLLGLIIILAIFVLVDPFGLDLLRLKRPEMVANVMPIDVPFYLSVDFRQLRSEDVDRIVWTFSEELRRDEVSALDKFNQELDEILEDALGLNFTTDVMPWLGGMIGVGLSDLELGEWGDVEEVKFILAFESRDNAKADVFLEKLERAVAEESGEPFIEETYQGVELHSLDTPDKDERIAFGRVGDLVLFSQHIGVIMDAIDVQDGEALADVDGFREVVANLPSDRALTMYINGERYLELMSGFAEMFYGIDFSELYGESIGGISDIGVGISIIDEGLQWDMAYTYTSDQMSDEILQSFRNVESHTAMLLPENTLVHFHSYRLDQAWQNLIETFEDLDSGTDYEEAMEMFEFSFGFNPSLDLFPRLDGEWGFGLIPSSKGILAEEGEIPFGFVLLSETSDVEGLLTVCEDFSTNAELQGMGEVDTAEDQAAVYYELVDMFSGSTIMAYGAGSEYFFIGSSSETVQDLFSDRVPLSESVTYRNVWKAFPRDMAPLFYIDIEGIIANLRENMSAAERDSFDEDMEGFVDKLRFLAFGGKPLDKDMMHVTMILFIETE